MISKATARKRAQRAIPLTECENCGSRKNLQRHHPDHSKPLDVQILCQACHTAVEMQAETWGRGPIKAAQCQICNKTFQPKRGRRAKLCGAAECLRENGRRAAARRWG